MADELIYSEKGENGYYLNIEGYYDKIHRTTWARRTAGMLAGATLGAAYGFIVGALAAFLPYLLKTLGVPGAEGVTELPSLAAIGSSGALFGAVASGIGMLITADVAANAASSAVGMEEKEMREKLEALKSRSPVEVCTDCAVESAVVREDIRQMDDGVKGPPLFSWKVAAITMPLFAAFGTLIALNQSTAAAVLDKAFPVLTSGGVSTASVIASASTFGMFGSLLGMKTSLLTNKLANFYYDLVTEKIFEKDPPLEKVTLPSMRTPEHLLEAEQQVEEVPGKSFASREARFSLQALIEREKSLGQGR